MKTKRQSKILEIIETRAVETQEELMGVLQEQGFPVTQATISRDIKELRLVKVQDRNGAYRYAASRQENKPIASKYNTIFRDSLVSIDDACNLVVVKCHAGMAQAACAAVDALQWPLVIGTLAGDDTFVCITKSHEQAVQLMEELKKL